MNPVAFHIMGKPIYWYGIFAAAGFMVGFLHWHRLARRVGWDPNIAADLAFWTMVLGFTGARIAYVAANWSAYRTDWWEILRVDRGGLVYYGGFIGGVVAVAGLARFWRRGILELGDFTISALPLGHAMGRIGCFINGCCYGVEMLGPWPWAVGPDRRHPVQLYEAIANLLIYFELLRAWPRRRAPGELVARYLIFYPSVRFVLEFYRGDPRDFIGSLTVAQLISLVLAVMGVMLGAYLRHRSGKVEGTAHRLL